MKAILKVSAVVLAVALIEVAFKPLKFYSASEREKVIFSFVGQSLQTAHYESITFDDAFSSKIFDEYMEKLDYGKRYFLKSDIEEFEKYRYKIDNAIKTTDFEFYNLVTSVIKKRQDQAKSYWEEALAGDFDFSVDEYIQTEPDSLQYCESEAALKDYWRKIAKLAVLERYCDLVDAQDTAIAKKDTSYTVKSLDELKKDAINSVKEQKRFYNFKDKDWLSFFLNSIVAACDPHSEFFMPDDKTNFDISMSGKFEGIGATLQSRNGQTKVVDIIPGSASWRQGELEVNDVIQKVGQGDNEPIDITNMELDDVVKMVRGKKGSTVKLTVKKIDGTVKVIPIERDVVVIEETYAKSSILTSPDGKTRVGYIYLPKFYADFNDKNGRFCSKDVKTELEKLNRENVDGVVLDLRNNGGGSLSDVVDMSGLFIEKGPIVQVKTKDGLTRQLSDKSSEIYYSGPLVVMVNSFSASASEILSAAMQDYDRAIIMGSESSYGKGTVQSIYDFDNFLPNNNDIKPLGAIKITIQKFYRINGGTTQLRGVIPDIIVPDSYSYLKVGEKETHNPLPYDEISKADYMTWEHSYRKKKVVSNSKDRIKNNPIFKQIDENAKRLKARSDQSLFTLNIEKYRDEQRALKIEADKFSNIGKDKTGLKASYLAADKKSVANDTVKAQKFTRWFGDLEKDIYLLEATNVIGDMK
ncbi:MAG: carboxy terminal-processing peptidase [Bacteroidales bacterium]|nr:carboxy terminal-processing peptidase [Bacteroidales bacterium]